MKKGIIILATVALALALVPAAFAQPAQGPFNVNSYFPVWVQDSAGLQVDIPTPPIGVGAGGKGGGVVINPPTMTFAAPMVTPDPQAAFSQQIGFGAECRYWGASAAMDIGGIKKGALLTTAIEASFLPQIVADGNQFIFSRVRIRIDTPVAGDYRVTHPYGVETFTGVPAGARSIDFTADIGGPPGKLSCPNPMFTNPQSILVKGLLIADTINVQPPGANPPDLSNPAAWVGDGVTPTTTHGGPHGPAGNIFKVEYLGPAANANLDGAGNNAVSTNLFVVSGHLFGGTLPVAVPPPPPPTPLAILRATYARAAALTIDVFAASDPDAALTADIGGLTNLPMTGDGAGNFFIHHSLPRAFPVPPTVTVRAAGPAPEVPATLSAQVGDVVTITTNIYSAAGKTLRIAARSSDTLPQPALTAVGFGPIPVNGGVKTFNLGPALTPPATITVTSAAGGADTQMVSIVP